jgi:Mrp family chromosome partitioning ATPase
LERISRPIELARAPRETRDETTVRTPVLAVDRALLERARVLPPGAGGPHGAAYKMLRTQVLKRLDQLGANVLALISPGAQDGKTLTAINLAIAIAADAGRTALLADFDLRNPSVHRRLGIEPRTGVEECLRSRRPVHEALARLEGYERLTILPARSGLEQSSELLSGQRTADVVTELRTRYVNRILIVDLSPALLADDALAFSRHMQAALLVVGEGRTRREDVTRTIELLHDIPIVGTVLNASRERATGYF